MMRRQWSRGWLFAAVVGLSFCASHEAQAIFFEPTLSYAAITHDPGPNALGLTMNPVSTVYTNAPLETFPDLNRLNVTSQLLWNANPTLAPTPIPTFTTFLNIPDATLAGGGVSHYTLPGNFATGDPGFANYSMSYNTGVGQDNTEHTFTGFSTLTVDLHMVWDASDGWFGSLAAYQFLGIDLASMAPGDESKVSATYDYVLDEFGESIDDTLHLDFADSNDTGNGVKSVFLFDNGVLRANNLFPTSTGKHTLTLDATITFEAKDPFEPNFSKLFPVDRRDDIEMFLRSEVDGFSQNPAFDTIFSLHGGGVGDYQFANPNIMAPPQDDPNPINSGATGIPEPSASVLILVGAGVLLARRKP